MSLDLDGWDDITSTLENLGAVGNKISTSSFRKSLKTGLDIVKAEAPRKSGESAKALKVGKVKKYKSGSIWGQIGIDASNWDKTKSLYFQNYGYEHYKSGERVQPHIGWIDEATNKAEAPVLRELETIVLSEIDKIMK